MRSGLDEAQRALLALGRALRDAGYTHTAITPESHRRVVARRTRAETPRDVFGWSLPFARATLPARWIDLLRAADALRSEDALLRSRVRFASLDGRLFAHSAWPTVEADAVFFGPDTYRFCAWTRRATPAAPRRLVDVGCGSGAGGLLLAAPGTHVVLADVNDAALRLAAVNAALNGVDDVEVVRSDVLDGVDGPFDLVVSNPPYLVDEDARVYRDGGGALGAALSLRIAAASLERLAPGGTLLLYTGVAMVDGADPFRRALAPLLRGVRHTYEELDPDVFGEELERPVYAAADRIAVVGLSVTKP